MPPPDDGEPGADDGSPPEMPWLEWWSQGPPWWFRAAEWLLTTLTDLSFGATVILQWGLWLIVGLNVVRPWGIALGVTIAAAQMLALFERRPRPVRAR